MNLYKTPRIIGQLLFVVFLLATLGLQVVSAQTSLPLCTNSLNLTDDDTVDQAMDVDKDGDGLIEICDLEGLFEMRFVPNGSGYRAEGTTINSMGCPSNGGCIGFELTKSLDFMDDDSYRTTANKVTYTVDDYDNAADTGWQPIGIFNNPFNTRFEGNKHTISNLMINRSTNDIGLFGITGGLSVIANVGLLNVRIEGNDIVGGLVGWTLFNGSSVMNSYATGSVEGNGIVGGLIGQNSGASITNSYATGSVSGNFDVGGLIGQNSGASITNSYATGSVNGNNNVGGLIGLNSGAAMNSYATGSVSGNFDVGGLVGLNSGAVTNSYATSSVSGDSDVGGLIGQNSGGSITDSYATGSNRLVGFNSGTISAKSGVKTEAQLQMPTMAIGIYSSWNPAVWDFGTLNQFPALKNSDGNLLPNQGMSIGGGLRESLRELRTSRDNTRFEPAFGVTTTHYVITISPVTSTMSNIVLELSAYNPDATISIVKRGETPVIDYFAGKGSSGSSEPILVDEDTILDITVSEPDTESDTTPASYTLTFELLEGILIRAKVFLEGPLQ